MGEKLYGLLGRKLGHSWSVPIHQALGRRDYRLIELEPGELGPFLAREDVGGLNVTIPYKRDVMAHCDALDENARAIGCVNTLVRREDGKLWGCNTDIDGFLYMLRRADISLAGKKVLILGSGGASLTARAAARLEGAGETVVISRSGPDNYGNLGRHADADVLVNTTPAGMWPDVEGRPVDLSLLPNLTAVADVIYNPTRTSLLLQAAERGRSGPLPIRCAGGLAMLVDQARAAEELFSSRPIPEEETERILSSLRRDTVNLVLVGMPGCGKTTVGRALSALSGKPFVDLDGEVVRMAGRPIPEIFARQGEAAFRELESRALAETCAKTGLVIATGGGAVLRAENRLAMRRTGQVYWLRRELGRLPTEGRPLSQGGSLEEMERIRRPLYDAASDVSVQNDTSAAETARRIWRDFCENSGN